MPGAVSRRGRGGPRRSSWGRSPLLTGAVAHHLGGRHSGLAFAIELAGRLGAESWLGGQGRDARPGVDEPLAGGGDVAVEVGEPTGRVRCPGHGLERVEPFLGRVGASA
jgi:hypothetical protein